jgi:heme exporter protein D
MIVARVVMGVTHTISGRTALVQKEEKDLALLFPGFCSEWSMIALIVLAMQDVLERKELYSFNSSNKVN